MIKITRQSPAPKHARTKLLLEVLVFGFGAIVAATFITQKHALAVNWGAIPTAIQSDTWAGQPGLIPADSGNTGNESPCNTNPASNRIYQVGYPWVYTTAGSQYDSETATDITYGTTPSSTFYFTNLTFLCHEATSHNTILTGGNIPADDTPVSNTSPIPGTGAYVTTDATGYIDSATITSTTVPGETGTTNLAGTYYDIPYNGGTRYWFPTSITNNGKFTFTGNAAYNTPNRVIETLTVTQRMVNTFIESGRTIYVCVYGAGTEQQYDHNAAGQLYASSGNAQSAELLNGSGQPVAGTNCPSGQLPPFYIDFNVLAPSQPPATFTNVSGTVYNGSTGGGLANVAVYSCMPNDREAAYDPGGTGIVGMAMDATGDGYWLAGPDGGVFTFGDASFYGSMGGRALNKPIVGIVATPDGGGYWLVGADGGVYAFGDAGYYNSLPGLGINVSNIVGMATTPDGHGYWLVGADGGVFAFGDATPHGSLPGLGVTVSDIVGMAATSNGGGYVLVGADGGAFAFGNAPSPVPNGLPAAGFHVNNIVSIAMDASNGGYWMVGSNGEEYTFGNAPGYGWTGAGTAVQILRTHGGNGYYILDSDGTILGPDAGSGSDAFEFYTNADGNYEFPISDDSSYCVRVISGLPGGLTGPTLDADYVALAGGAATSYECQMSAEYVTTPLGGSCTQAVDLNHDNGLNFEYFSPAALSCSGTTILSSPAPTGRQVGLQVHVASSGGNANVNLSMTINGVAYTGSYSGTVTSPGFTVNNITPSLDITFPGTYNTTIAITGSFNISCPATMVIFDEPYAQVTGGDVAAGSAFDNGNSCTPAASGDISSWNNNDGFAPAPPNYNDGSGGAFAVQAFGTIDGFVSAENLPAGSAQPPNGLSFANTSGTGTYGGQFGAVPCSMDYYQNHTDPNVTAYGPGSTSQTGAYYDNENGGTLTLNNVNIPNKKQVTVYVNGNVYITGNGIKYANAGGPDPNDITNFQLIVNGNIYIDPGVTELDGVYVAQGGTIYTCSDAGGVFQGANTCASQLTVNGDLIAGTIKLWRTYGTEGPGGTGIATHAPAESINDTPSDWLAKPNNPLNGQDDAITQLPPVL